MHTGFWWGSLKDRDRTEDLGLGTRIILKMDLQEMGWEAWI